MYFLSLYPPTQSFDEGFRRKTTRRLYGLKSIGETGQIGQSRTSRKGRFAQCIRVDEGRSTHHRSRAPHDVSGSLPDKIAVHGLLLVGSDWCSIVEKI